MHHPVGTFSLGRASMVVDKCFLVPHSLGVLRDGPVLSGSLPVANFGGPIRSRSIWILPIPRAEEIPLLIATLQL